MSPTALPFETEYCAEIDSTNAELFRRPTLPADPLWLVAGRQTRGRGQHGRPWLSRPGASLTASLALERTRPAGLGSLPLVAGVAIADALAGFGVPVRLKWPNDIYAPAALPDPQPAWAKAGGILCEARARGDLTRIVVGVGLNLAAPPAEEIDQAATGLFTGPPPLEAVAEAVGRSLVAAIALLLEQGFAPLHARWSALDLLAGEQVTVHPVVDGPAWTGTARGIDAAGALRVERDDTGTVEPLLSGRVSIRMRTPPTTGVRPDADQGHPPADSPLRR